MSEIALILYGRKAPHDQIIEGRDRLAADFRARGLDLAIAITDDPPLANIQPNVSVAGKPLYHSGGDLAAATHFRPGSLAEASVVYDRWSENYNRVGPGNQATGIGIESPVNHYSVQNLGRDKRAMGELVLGPLGIGIPTYSSDEAHQFLSQHPGKKVFAKPNNGSLGEGARPIDDVAALSGIDEGDILQEFCDTTGRLPFLRPYTAADREALATVNRDGLEKETRMYTFFSSCADGRVHKDFWPILRTRLPHGGKIARDSIMRTRIDPESVPAQYYSLAEACGDKIMQLTGARHLYIATDLGQGVTQLGQEKVIAVETNSRFPGLWEHASGAREMFADQAVIIAGG